MIDPATKKDGEEYLAYNLRRWGGDGWTHSLKDRGRQLGLPFARWTWWPNTLNSHRLCIYLDELDAARPMSNKEREDRALALVQKFYELTYERGCNISTPEGAAQAIEELGYAKAADATHWLAAGGGLDEVTSKDSYAKREMDIHGVPYFEISAPGCGRPVALSGAQSSSAFSKTFAQLAG